VNFLKNSRAAFPTLFRFATVLIGTLLVLFITFFLHPIDNSKLAGGAAVTVVVLGLSWLIGLSGQVSLGNAGFMAIGGYVAAIWSNHHAHSPLLVTFLLATVCSAFVGLIVALPSTRLRGPYLAGVTLAFSAAISPLAISLNTLTGGSGGLFVNYLVTPTWFAHFIGGSNELIVSNAQWPTDVMVVVAGVSIFLMSNLFNSRTGRAMRLVRDDDVAAELAGINVQRTRTLAFVVSAAYAGLGGSMLALLSGSVTPQTYSLSFSILLLTLMVLGGMGTLSGAVIGGLIYSYSNNLVSLVNNITGISATSPLGANLKGIVFGILLILCMLLSPRGIVGFAGVFRNLKKRVIK
jgi:branched-chain amino acid transport system permease protein